LKVSIALATLGLVIFLSASMSGVVSGTVSSVWVDGVGAERRVVWAAPRSGARRVR
jgi:hypothetical protein